MEVNFSELSEISDVDFCVIGSGPAGLTCALKLATAGRRILLAEGGGEEYSSESQELYQGEVIGDPYFALDVCRLRYFGGTSNHWKGQCRPLDDLDFQGKGTKAIGRWPIAKKELDPYFDQASSILELSKSPADLELADSGLKLISFSYSPPVRFKEKYLGEVRRSQNIILCLNCNFLNFEYADGSVTAAVFSSPSGISKKFSARTYLLCTGGIENSRLLAWSNIIAGGNLLNESAKNIGTRWTEHPTFWIGDAVITTDWNLYNGLADVHFFAPTEQFIQRNGILNCGLRLFLNPNREEATELLQDLTITAPNLSPWLCSNFQSGRLCAAKLRGAWEQEPVAENRITLSEDKDRLGIPKVNLHWKKSDRDLMTATRTAEELGHLLAQHNLGRLRLADWVLNGDNWPIKDELGGNHHMGGTCMGTSPTDAVVDSNLKLFYCSNVYVLGSSAFPSGGHANPTFTIVQLALRLAQYLTGRPR